MNYSLRMTNSKGVEVIIEEYANSFDGDLILKQIFNDGISNRLFIAETKPYDLTHDITITKKCWYNSKLKGKMYITYKGVEFLLISSNVEGHNVQQYIAAIGKAASSAVYSNFTQKEKQLYPDNGAFNWLQYAHKPTLDNLIKNLEKSYNKLMKVENNG